MTFSDEYFKIYELVKPDIEKVTKDLVDLVDVSEPMKTSVVKFLSQPSKHIRTLVAFLYLKACGKPLDSKQIALQVAVELVHNASLIHDDVIDDSDVRRKQKSFNSEFDSKLAVIAGDYLLSVALKIIREIGSFDLLDLFSCTLAQMCLGEVSQYFSKFEIPTLETYIEKSKQKTATLFRVAIEGAAIVSADLDRSQAEGFATRFGIAFQVRDDLINVRTTGTDIRDGIYTAPVIFAGSCDNASLGIEKTEELLDNYVQKARDSLREIQENEYKAALIKLTELLKHE